jgi:UDP-N-acetyl-D-glucosamine dehydrogenase
MGYVGLPLALAFAARGFRVLGLDVDEGKIASLKSGQSYIHHIPASRVSDALAQAFDATSDFTRLEEVDAVILCVPTPLGPHREPDLSYVVDTTEVVARTLQAGQLVVLESTTFPGTTRDVMRPILERGGMVAGKDFHLAYSPEREDPSNPEYNTTNIPKLIGGYTERCGLIAAELYGQVVDKVVLVGSCEVAEASKIVENTFRAVNIAMVNELKIVFSKMGIDIWSVLDAAGTKPFGFMRFNPGPGLGGHCIPIDPFYLTWKAHEYDIPIRFIEMAGQINSQMPQWVCQRLLEALSMRGAGIKNARVLIVGMAYKKNVDDDRESPSYKLMSILHGYGASVDFHDPYVSIIKRTRHYPEFAGMQSVELTDVGSYDVVLIATDHDCIDWESLRLSARLIVDARGVYRSPHENVIPA